MMHFIIVFLYFLKKILFILKFIIVILSVLNTNFVYQQEDKFCLSYYAAMEKIDMQPSQGPQLHID